MKKLKIPKSTHFWPIFIQIQVFFAGFESENANLSQKMPFLRQKMPILVRKAQFGSKRLGLARKYRF